MPEAHLVRDLIYVFQGVDGQYVRLHRAEDAFCIDHQVSRHTYIKYSINMDTWFLYTVCLKKTIHFLKWLPNKKYMILGGKV